MEKIIILDFGSQYTQLIARRIRELHVYCEIILYYHEIKWDDKIKGIVLSGSPFSVNQQDFLDIDFEKIKGKIPVLAICYGAQLLAKKYGGMVAKSEKREYGRAIINICSGSKIFENIETQSQVWMSHGDSIMQLPDHTHVIAKTDNIPHAAYQFTDSDTYCLQFHPEVYHSTEGRKMIQNFLLSICGCKGDWTEANFIDATITELKETIAHDKVLLGLSGGVDSTVAAVLLHKAIGSQLTCVFVNNGLLRKNEYNEVLAQYTHLQLQVIGVDASSQFYDSLKNLSDPEDKRKAIGKTFIDIFDQEASKLKDIKWLAQGTIYPDVIESMSVLGPSATIKSHHNVGGMPEKINLNIVEPLRKLFKDEVRRVGHNLGISKQMIDRHPFPGPGLAIRILGDITAAKVALLQEVDAIYIRLLREHGWYDKIWQAGAILLNAQSVGVMGDERTYEHVIALRAVSSTDGMTADWVQLPYELMALISNEIINNVKGINRVVYDISSKPPATIEWE